MLSRPPAIGLLSPCGWGNLGDAAIQDAVIQQLRARHPAVSLCAFSLNPQDTSGRHGIPAFPLNPMDQEARPSAGGAMDAGPAPGSSLTARLKRVPVLRGIWRLLRTVAGPARRAGREVMFSLRAWLRLRSLDVLLMSGGGQLDDSWGGPWGHPYTLWRWCVLARLAGARVVFLGVGAGPLRAGLSRFFVRRALRLAAYRSYRDDDSRAFVERLGIGRPGTSCPDLAYAIRLPTAAPRNHRTRPRVGLGPMPYGDPRCWPEKDPAGYAAYLDKLASLVQSLDQDGYEVVLFPSQTSMDMPVIDDLLGRLSPTFRQAVQAVGVAAVNDLLQALRDVDFVIASRYHGALLAMLVHTPVVALAYHPKVRALMQDMGQSAFCLDINQFSARDVHASLSRLAESAEACKREIAARVAECRERLHAEFDAVLSPGAAPEPTLAPILR